MAKKPTLTTAQQRQEFVKKLVEKYAPQPKEKITLK